MFCNFFIKYFWLTLRVETVLNVLFVVFKTSIYYWLIDLYIYGLFDCFCLVILVLVIFSVSFASCFVLFCFPWNFCSIFFLLHTYHFSYRLHLQFCVTAFSKQWFVDVGALVGGEGGVGGGNWNILFQTLFHRTLFSIFAWSSVYKCIYIYTFRRVSMHQTVVWSTFGSSNIAISSTSYRKLLMFRRW